MSDASCERCVDLLGDYVEGRLAPDARRALEDHVAACERCATIVREYRTVPAIVRHLTDDRMPYDVEVRLRRLLSRAQKPGS